MSFDIGFISKGFPVDDERSVLAGCCGNFSCNCSADLDVYYPHQFVQNEEIANVKSGNLCSYKFEHANIVKNAMCGTVYYDQLHIFTFQDKDGILLFDNEFNSHKSHPALISGTVNYEDGVITLNWSEKIPPGISYIVTSYEYNLECVSPEKIECPKCKHSFFKNVKDDILSLQELANGECMLDMY